MNKTAAQKAGVLAASTRSLQTLDLDSDQGLASMQAFMKQFRDWDTEYYNLVCAISCCNTHDHQINDSRNLVPTAPFLDTFCAKMGLIIALPSL